MAHPPPVRPWFRLTSIRAAPVPAPAPAPAPAPPPAPPPAPQTQPTQPAREPTPPPQEAPSRFALDARTSAPSSPSHKVPNAHSSSSAASPLHKAAATTNSASSSPSRKAISTSSPQSPRTIKQAVAVHQNPMQSSPKLKPASPPPSPLTLPPSQAKIPAEAEAEAEPKTVLVETTVDRPRQWLNGHRETGQSRNHAKHEDKGVHKKLSDSEDSAMRVITIAGENRGAYMELIQKQEPYKHLYKTGISKNKSDGSESESSSSREGKANNNNNNKGRGASSFPMAAYMNSNVQCVNNSLLYHASCSHHDPGVRLSLSKKPFDQAYHLKEPLHGHSV